MSPSVVLAWHEFKRLVIRWGFLIKVVGAPFLIVAYIALLGVVGIGIGYTLSPKEITIGFVNQSPLSFRLPEQLNNASHFTLQHATKTEEGGVEGNLEVLLYQTAQQAKHAIENGEITCAFIIPMTFLETPEIEFMANSSVSLYEVSMPREKFKRIVRDEVVTHFQIPEALRKALHNGFPLKTNYIDEVAPEKDVDESSGLDIKFASLMNRHGYYIFIGLLISVLFANTERFSNSATREKESKLLDVILSSIPPEQYVLGKILGIVSASILQYMIWIGFFYSIPLLVQTLLKQPVTLEISTHQLILSSLFSFCGMVFYGSFITACTFTKKEADQPTLMRIWLSLFGIASLWILFAILSRSDDMGWHLLSLVPLFTPFLQIIQLGNSDYSPLLASAYLLYMTLATYLMIRLAGHILRVGIQLRGQEFSLLIKIKLYLRRNS